MLQYVAGDLFVNRFNAKALAHGCNCQGSMGTDIAVGFKQRYPAMYEEYRRRCKATPREFNPRHVFLWQDVDKPRVFNLATQEDYWRSRATYENIEGCLSNMKRLADEEGILSIAIPRLGAGYGGLSWNKVKAITDRVYEAWSGTLYVYEQYVAETQ